MWQKKHHTRLFGLLLACGTSLVCAETRYVTDELQLSLYEETNSQGALLQRLNSGTELELLDLQGMYAKVRTKEGVEGWTKAGFLITEKPARAQLLDLKQENEALQNKLEESQRQVAASRGELEKLQQNQGDAYGELTERLAQAEKVAATVEQLRQENDEFRGRLDSDELLIPVNWALIASGIALVLGMIAGIALFDYRSRRRHGGYRIY